MWKLSQYTVARELADRGLADHVLIYNNESRRCFTARREAWASILASLAAPEAAEAAVRRAVASLAGKGFIVPLERDERATWSAAFDRGRHGRRSIFPLLAVTTACNIGCSYCYEEGVTPETMRADVVEGVLRWMARRVRLDGVQEINPGLFGGEPLLYPRLLFQIMDGFAELCRRLPVRGRFYTSSNGVLLTESLAETLAGKGLGQIQISLDGPQAVHDERRMGKRGEGTYAESLRGLQVAARFIEHVTLKVNFDRHNRARMREVFAQVEALGLAGRINVKLEAIALQMPGSKVAHDPQWVIPPESPELAEAYVELMQECQRRGIAVSDDTAHTTPCMFTSDHGVLIGPDGEIYKCISLVGRKEFSVGSVFEEDYRREEYDRQMNPSRRLDPCFAEACAYVPVCAGGCAYEAIVRTEHYRDRNCTKEFLERFHYLRYLLRHQAELVPLGMRPLSPEELAVAAEPARPRAGEPLVQLRRRAPRAAAEGSAS